MEHGMEIWGMNDDNKGEHFMMIYLFFVHKRFSMMLCVNNEWLFRRLLHCWNDFKRKKKSIIQNQNVSLLTLLNDSTDSRCHYVDDDEQEDDKIKPFTGREWKLYDNDVWSEESVSTYGIVNTHARDTQ